MAGANVDLVNNALGSSSWTRLASSGTTWCEVGGQLGDDACRRLGGIDLPEVARLSSLRPASATSAWRSLDASFATKIELRWPHPPSMRWALPDPSGLLDAPWTGSAHVRTAKS